MSSIDKTAAVTAEIRNCNNISSGKVSWEKEKLNIKYGLNGTGKTTIGKAVIASSKIKSELHHVEYTLLLRFCPCGRGVGTRKRQFAAVAYGRGSVKVIH